MTTTTATLTDTTDTTSAPARRTRRFARAAVLVGLVGALTGTAATAASAYTTTSRSGVSTPTIYQVQGAHANIGSAVTGPMWKPYVYQSGPVVSRTASSGAQYVSVRYTVLRWTGSAWATETTAQGSATIAATSTSVKLPSLSTYVGGGYSYRVLVSMTWTSQIGGVLGSFNARMDTTGDYVCSTTHTCSAGNAIYLR